jgi:HAD superfamily hydrolase (TIGR01509 family)
VARTILFDWGGTLMSEDGPLDVSMGLWPEVRALPGAQLTLAALAPRYRLALATNATVSRRDMIERALERVALRRYISEIFCFTEIGARKDAPEFWAAVVERLDAKPSELAMVGDSLDQDVLAPRRFGIHSIWFNEDGRQPAPVEALPTVHRLPELIPLIGSWAGRASSSAP